MKERLMNLLGMEYPIIEGGMAYIGDGRLAAAVSNSGVLAKSVRQAVAWRISNARFNWQLS